MSESVAIGRIRSQLEIANMLNYVNSMMDHGYLREDDYLKAMRKIQDLLELSIPTVVKREVR